LGLKSKTIQEFKETEIGKIPIDWEVKKMQMLFHIFAGGDLSKISFSKTKSNEYKYPVYSNTIDNKGIYGFSKEYQYEPECVTITARGVNTGRAECRKEPFSAIVRLLVLKPKQKLSCYFITNFINTKLNFPHVGSAQNQLTAPMLSETLAIFPPLDEQEKIGKTLDDLDAKIENLQNQNHTLEQMAQVIFKSWFVNFDGVTEWDDSELGKIPKGWTVSTLSNLTSFDIGGTWGKEIPDRDFNSPSFCIRGKNIPEIINGDDSKTVLLYGKKSIQEKRTLIPHDIVIEISGGSSTQLTGRSLLITEKLLSRFQFPLLPASFCKLIRFEDKKFSFFVYFLLRFIYDTGKINQYETGTTAIKNFQYTIFSKDYKFALPPTTILDKFNQIIQSIFSIMDNNVIEIQKLVKIHDILLPKLMSGEIRV
jgi:type I restriction enzyme, S subunit